MLLLWALLGIVFCLNGGSAALLVGSSMVSCREKKRKKKKKDRPKHKPPTAQYIFAEHAVKFTLVPESKQHTSNRPPPSTHVDTQTTNHGECISNKASLQRFSNILLQETETLFRQAPPSPRLSHLYTQVAVSVSVSKAVVQAGRRRQAARQETQIQSPFTPPLPLSFLFLPLPITITTEPVFEIQSHPRRIRPGLARQLLF